MKHKLDDESDYCITCGRTFDFPEAPHTAKGQQLAREVWQKHMKRMFKQFRKMMIEEKGLAYVQKMERAFRVKK